MKATRTKIPSVQLIKPSIFVGERGLIFESLNEQAFNADVNNTLPLVKDNHSKSMKGVPRGQHYQLTLRARGNLVREVHGEVFDVAVDISKDSATYGQCVGEIISANKKKQLWIPSGFAHVFLALSDIAEFFRKTTYTWSPKYERAILCNDATLNIQWPLYGMRPTYSGKERC